MSPQATILSPKALTDAASALILAYNEKDWARAKTTITPTFLYEEIATGRRIEGADQTIEAWKGWATAFPDSQGSLDQTHVAGNNTVVLELTWRGTHQGVLQTPTGGIPPTGKRIEIRAVAVIEVAGEKARTQRHFFDMATLLQQLGIK
ncbi:MAG: ester cyclase [Gemmatimonadales bacterium]